MHGKKKAARELSRRAFLQKTGVYVPTYPLVLQSPILRARQSGRPTSQTQSTKTTPIDLRRYFNTSPTDLGPRDRAKGLGGDLSGDGLIRTPAGMRNLRGIPFLLGPEGLEKKRWLTLSLQSGPWATRSVDIPLHLKATFLCLASFCDWDENERTPFGVDVIEKVGQKLANAVLVYEDGSEKIIPIRRRFEVNSPSISIGHFCFAAETHIEDKPTQLTDPLSNALQWGLHQTSVIDNHYPGEGIVWVCALANPEPERTIESVQIRATAEDPLVICGLTLFRGRENPLRYGRLTLYRVTLPEVSTDETDRWKVDVDLGVVARKFFLKDFNSTEWLQTPGWGPAGSSQSASSLRHLYLDVAASSEASLTLHDRKTGREYAFDLGPGVPGQESQAQPDGTSIEVLERDKVWLHAQVLDAATHQPTPVRLAFRSRQGRYIPPYGHRSEINDGYFQDYGADLKLGDASFAYVDGAFQVELPVGEVFLEMTKGYEYEAVRQRLTIKPHQRELTLQIPRFADLRSRGWVTADVHVHFLSPTTAVLEGQAEGLNLINVLAAQWGDHFTNMGDMAHGPLNSRDGETIVWVGTENRNHILGHLALLGGHSIPRQPVSSSGPSESYLGDPVWNSMADWADDCRKRDGLVVAAHFPYPTAELAADIVLGKIDAVELWPHFRLGYRDWYRYLDCGYRLPAVGGTDKMSAGMAAGANRTYAYIGKDEFSFVNWAKAVRRGNTFVTGGPLLLFQVNGRTPGEEITIGPGGGTLEVYAEAKCFAPELIHKLEVVLNGRVVSSSDLLPGAKEVTLKDRIHVSGPGWLAARCVTQQFVRASAHTSPVYVAVPGRDQFSAPMAAYLLTLIEGTEDWLENLATRPDPERFARVLRSIGDARGILHQRLHQHRTVQ